MIDRVCQKKIGDRQDFYHEYSLVIQRWFSEMEILDPSLFRFLKMWYDDSTARLVKLPHIAFKLTLAE